MSWLEATYSVGLHLPSSSAAAPTIQPEGSRKAPPRLLLLKPGWLHVTETFLSSFQLAECFGGSLLLQVTDRWDLGYLFNMPGRSRIDARGLYIKSSPSGSSGLKSFRITPTSLLCYRAVRGLGISMAELSKRLSLSLSGLCESVDRGERSARDKSHKFIDH